MLVARRACRDFRVSAGSAVDLMKAKTSEAESLSRGEARLRRRAKRALDRLSASEKTSLHEVDGALGRRMEPGRARNTTSPLILIAERMQVAHHGLGAL